jgi:hypothetical protein
MTNELITVDLGLMPLNRALELGLVKMIDNSTPKTGGQLSRRVEALVRDTTMSYKDIVAMVQEEFPDCNTSTKSVASVASTMRKNGTPVPLRLKLNLVG